MLPWSFAGRDTSSRAQCKNQLFAALDWVPTLVDIAGGPKGDGLKKQIEAGKYPGIVKTTLDGVDQRDYLEGKSEKSARDYFFYYSGATPSAVRYKNWKMYYTMSQPGADGWVMPLIPFHLTWCRTSSVTRSSRPSASTQKSAIGHGRCAGGPVTAFLYDWNMLPIGQQLWYEQLMSYKSTRRCRRRNLEPGCDPEASAGSWPPERLAA